MTFHVHDLSVGPIADEAPVVIAVHGITALSLIHI